MNIVGIISSIVLIYIIFDYNKEVKELKNKNEELKNTVDNIRKIKNKKIEKSLDLQSEVYQLKEDKKRLLKLNDILYKKKVYLEEELNRVTTLYILSHDRKSRDERVDINEDA